ncbi:MAG: prepilin-type N-terminal cleavage/methylation domain-containing protein [Phycisphaerales bacterium]|nr:prepilin-type N-terminal cleavage/methylation domain-containing protein [Phycisphaerales bacterium]MCI0632085.1 prepilin-type N-terminal cleavage/methylation domain-containing protein [Phycisphaerales bacterium]MCI0677005.1 prepilin-type N-terminal cleavage/methylation domain-containing protein [Phycisphaerales bacterium]
MKNQRAEIRDQRSVRGFSLIEMMVVIGVIVVLMGLFTGVAVTLNSRNDVRQAESIIAIMDQALKQWETTSERQITYGTPGQPPSAVYDLSEAIYGPNGNNNPPLQGVFLEIIMQDPAAAKILTQIPEKYLKLDNANNPRITDPWGQEIKILFPGRLWVRADPDTVIEDVDNTIRLADETIFGPCVGRRICFISGGPDGKLKPDVQGPSGTDRGEFADNIYSYPLVVLPPSPTMGGPLG